jgi:hypothetical protein
MNSVHLDLMSAFKRSVTSLAGVRVYSPGSILLPQPTVSGAGWSVGDLDWP